MCRSLTKRLVHVYLPSTEIYRKPIACRPEIASMPFRISYRMLKYLIILPIYNHTHSSCMYMTTISHTHQVRCVVLRRSSCSIEFIVIPRVPTVMLAKRARRSKSIDWIITLLFSGTGFCGILRA